MLAGTSSGRDDDDSSLADAPPPSTKTAPAWLAPQRHEAAEEAPAPPPLPTLSAAVRENGILKLRLEAQELTTRMERSHAIVLENQRDIAIEEQEKLKMEFRGQMDAVEEVVNRAEEALQEAEEEEIRLKAEVLNLQEEVQKLRSELEQERSQHDQDVESLNTAMAKLDQERSQHDQDLESLNSAMANADALKAQMDEVAAQAAPLPEDAKQSGVAQRSWDFFLAGIAFGAAITFVLRRYL